jgi:helix-turn-helix protein
VTRAFTEGRGAYGCRVAAQLNRERPACSVGLVADLMRELGLAGCQPRAYKRTTVPSEGPVRSPDLIGREFSETFPTRTRAPFVVAEYIEVFYNRKRLPQHRRLSHPAETTSPQPRPENPRGPSKILDTPHRAGSGRSWTRRHDARADTTRPGYGPHRASAVYNGPCHEQWRGPSSGRSR